MTEAYARTPLIGRTGMLRPRYEAARSTAADSPCFSSCNAAKTGSPRVHRTASAAVGTGRARCLWQAVAVCWAGALPTTAIEAGRALEPMLPASAREPWPCCVVRDSCHSAVPDQPVCRQSARDAGLVAIIAAHASSDLPLVDTSWVQWVLGHAACVCLCQIASQWVKRPLSHASTPMKLS